LNGVKLINGTDFTATNGTSIVLASGAASGDLVEIIAFETFSVANVLTPANNLSDVNDAATARTNLGLAIGTDVQAYDAQLADVAGLTPTDGNFIVGNGTNFVAESGATARTSLGLGSIATAATSDYAATANNLSDLASAATARTNLGLAIGTDVQAYDATILNAADIGVTVQGYDADTAKLDVAQTFTTNQTVTAEFKATSYNETYSALSGTTPSVDCETGNVFSLSTTGNTTFTFSNPPATGTAYGMLIKLTAGGTHTITWPASVDWAGGTAPDAPASGETDVLGFITHDGGTTWYGFLAGDALA
jgi:hypothetical protein